MIFGVLERIREKNVSAETLVKISEQDPFHLEVGKVHINENFGCYYQPTFKGAYYRKIRPAAVNNSEIVVVFTGKIYNYEELKNSLRDDLKKCVTDNPATLILCLYTQYEQKFIGNLNGKFAFAIWDKSKNWLQLVRDRLGIEPLYYYIDNEKIIFSSRIKEILQYPGVKKDLNYQAFYQFMLFNYNPGLHTFFEQVHKLRPAHILNFRNGEVDFRRYWTLSFSHIIQTSEKEISEKLLELLNDAIKIRIEPGEEMGIFLSGGMDSSTMTGLGSKFVDRPLHTFSYRCKSQSFDESHYAKIMSSHYRTIHHEVEYRVQDVLEMEKIVALMDEPFCDVGINIASYILGREASKFVNYVVTGDGGDELFAGHPVYEADKLAMIIDKIPGFIKAPVFGISKLLPDSDKKKNLIVKLKRFALSAEFPKELLSHRWRIYYNFDEIKSLFTPQTYQVLNGYHPYEDVLQFNKEADGEDFLSKALYSDYHTVVQFYLRRMNLNNQFHLEPRYPMLDHRLVEFCSTLPSDLKFKGMSDTKYIFKKTMAGILPDEIVFRKDKLGHSIPLKNWMRDNQKVKDFVFDHLTETTIKKRGYFNPKYIEKLIKQHLSKSRNNSHRLWALAVLEMWMQHNFDK